MMELLKFQMTGEDLLARFYSMWVSRCEVTRSFRLLSVFSLGPLPQAVRSVGTENSYLLTFDYKEPGGTKGRHKVPRVGTTRYLLPWDKRALPFVFNDRSRLTGHMFVLLLLFCRFQFLSHPVVYNLLNSRWYRSFASVRKEPWTSPSRWGYFFLNLWPVLDVFLFPVVFACFFIVHFIKRLWRKTRGW